MVDYISYILILVSLLSGSLIIYNIYCFITLNKGKGKFNLYKIILAKHPKLKGAAKKIIMSSISTLVITCLISAALGAVVYNLSTQLKAISVLTQSVFCKDEDCPCYALCTGDSKIDAKCTYQLLFGKDEYIKLTEHMELNDVEKAEFDEIDKGDNGKQKNEFIKAHLNETMVFDYKQLVGENKNFRSKDGKDRTQMSIDELTTDLKKLLSDYKVNGRNPNCECQTSSSILLKTKCLGVKHYEKGWSWKSLWDPDAGLFDTTSGSGGWATGGQGNTTGSIRGQATGQYAVQLDDGTYYWYHQSRPFCGCTYCGNWSQTFWGFSGNQGNNIGRDGCAIYSLAIGISNLVGQEITPAKVLETLDSPIASNGTCTTSPNYFTGSGRMMGSRDSVLAKLASTYNFSYEAVGRDIASIDTILSKGGYVWTSWVDANSAWCGNGSSHFMMIRKQDGNNYYCFTSCGGKCTTSKGKEGAIQTMNYPIEKQAVINAMTNNPIYGIWTDYVPSNSTGQSDIPQTSGSSWYSSAAAMTVGTPTSIKVCSGTVSLYTGLPWAPTADTYFYNAKQAAEDINTYIGTQAGLTGGKYKPEGVRSTFHWGSPRSGASAILDGVVCGRFAPSPCTVDRTFCDNFTYDTWMHNPTPPEAIYGKGSRKYCAVLSDANGTKYFLPLVAVDSKGHTFPGGVCQSHVKAAGYDAASNLFTVDLGDTAGHVYQQWAPSEIASRFDTVTVEAGGHPSVYFQNNLEIYGIPNTSEFNGFTLEGFIAW